MCRQNWDHVENPIKSLSKVRRIVSKRKKGTLLLIQVPKVYMHTFF